MLNSILEQLQLYAKHKLALLYYQTRQLYKAAPCIRAQYALRCNGHAYLEGQ
jgi:hypothetical protein